MVEKHLLGKGQFVFVFPFEAQHLFGERPSFSPLLKHNTYWGNTKFFSPFELQQQIRPHLTSCWQQTQPDQPFMTADPTTPQAITPEVGQTNFPFEIGSFLIIRGISNRINRQLSHRGSCKENSFVSASSKVRSTRQGSKVGFPNSPCARKSVSAGSWSAMCEMVSKSESSLEVYCVQGSMCGLLCSF